MNKGMQLKFDCHFDGGRMVFCHLRRRRRAHFGAVGGARGLTLSYHKYPSNIEVVLLNEILAMTYESLLNELSLIIPDWHVSNLIEK